MELQTLVWLTLALGAGAIAKGATGLGLPLVALPLLTASVGLQKAIGIMLIPVLVTNAYQLWAYREAAGLPGLAVLPRFLLGGVAGIALGTWALDALPERVLQIGLGLILLAYVAQRILRPSLVLSTTQARRIGPAAGVAAGALQGATGIAGPVAVTFIHAMGLDRRASVFAISAIFMGFAMVQYGAMVLAGIYRTDWIGLGLFACLPVLLLMPVGDWLGRRTSPQMFSRLILLFLFFAGAKMILGL